MKKTLFTLLLSCILISLFSQTNNQISIGQIDSIESTILGEERKIWVHVPDNGRNEVFSESRYPVVYLLDGTGHFSSVVGMIEQLSSVNGNTICPKMIVVGIPNTNRTRDLTPSKGDPNHPFTDSSMVAQSGGGMEFLSFLEKELIPYIDSNYPTMPYRMYVGHSFGGLAVLNAFVNKPELFQSYIAIDPSMWWANRKLLNEIKAHQYGSDYEGKELCVAIANTMSEGMDTIAMLRDTSFETEHIRAIFALHHFMQSKRDKPFEYHGKYYQDDDHGSVPLIAEYDALRNIFDYHQLKMGMKDFLDPQSNLAQKISGHYKNISQNFGIEVKPEEQMVNSMGYQFMDMGQMDKARGMFELNVVNYPESFNVYDSLGDYFRQAGETEKAIENYRKAVELSGNAGSREKLEELLNH